MTQPKLNPAADLALAVTRLLIAIRRNPKVREALQRTESVRKAFADLLDATDAAIESIPDTDWHEAQVRNLQ
jgi:hypothetical protein